MKGGGTDGGQEKGIGRKRGGGARAKTTTRVNENIDRRARPREKRLACWFPRGAGGRKIRPPRRARRGLRAGSREAARARSRRAARAAVAGARGARDGRARGFVRVGGGARRRRRDANYIHQTRAVLDRETVARPSKSSGLWWCLAPRGVPGARVSSAARRAGTHLGLGVRADDGADAARSTAAREGGARGHADAAAREARASARGVARRCRDGRDAGDGGDRLARHGSTV